MITITSPILQDLMKRNEVQPVQNKPKKSKDERKNTNPIKITNFDSKY